jgi:hypothetical protein
MSLVGPVVSKSPPGATSTAQASGSLEARPPAGSAALAAIAKAGMFPSLQNQELAAALGTARPPAAPTAT